jgi:YVTN family beta-propeller protein
LIVDGTRVWVANYWSNSVQAIDPASREVDAPLAVGNGPTALAFDGARLWGAN